MGWMHDTLRYFAPRPDPRSFHHDELTFRAVYAWSENYVLPLSHDEVVHGKRSLAAKMPGEALQQLANLRLLFGYQWALPGKKLCSWAASSHSGASGTTTVRSTGTWKSFLRTSESGGGSATLNRELRAHPSLHELDSRSRGIRMGGGRRPRRRHARVPALRERRVAHPFRRELHARRPARHPDSPYRAEGSGTSS